MSISVREALSYFSSLPPTIHPTLYSSILFFRLNALGRISEVLGSPSGCHFEGSLRALLHLFLALGVGETMKSLCSSSQTMDATQKTSCLGVVACEKLCCSGAPHSLNRFVKALWLLYAKQSAGMRERPKQAQARTSLLRVYQVHPHHAAHTLMLFLKKKKHFLNDAHRKSKSVSHSLLFPPCSTLVPSLLLFFSFCHAKIIRFM